jgi:hypothetical protein
MNEYGSLSL